MSAKNFWQRVRQLNKAKKATQKELAHFMGISLRTMENWIHRDIYPIAPDAHLIAIFFGVSVEYLVTGKERKEQRKISLIRSLLKKADDKLQRV